MESMSEAKNLLRRHKVRRVGASILSGFALGLPIAGVHSFTHTEINDDIASIPSTLAFAPHESRLETGMLGTVYDDGRFTKNGIGVSITVQQPPAGLESIGSSDPRSIIQPFVNYYAEPNLAFAGSRGALATEFKDNFKKAELIAGTTLSFATLALLSLTAGENRRKKILAFSPLVAISLGGAAVEYNEWVESHTIPSTTYKINRLQGTALEGMKTNSQATAQAIDVIVPYAVRQKERLDEQRDKFIARAKASIDAQLRAETFTSPRSGETTVLLVSDMHSNLAMIDTYRYLLKGINSQSKDPIVSTMVSAGDQTYGSAAEKVAVKRMSDIVDTVIAVNGNHDGDVTIKNQQDAGIKTIEGVERITAGDIPIIGASDPSITKTDTLLAGGNNASRKSGKEIDIEKQISLQQMVGEEVQQLAEEQKAWILAFHEGYSLGPIVGQRFTSRSEVEQWMNSPAATTRDLSASLTIFGHWHPDSAVIKIVNGESENSAIIELGSAGGASAKNRIGSFSTPFTIPIQQASAMFATFDEKGILIRLQEFRTNTEGNGEFQPAVEINTTSTE